MKKTLLCAVAVGAFLLSSTAFAISVTGNATAIIKKTITATQATQMNYGTISSSAAPATVTLSAVGTRTTTLGYYGTSVAGVFNISAEPSTALTISFTNGTLTSGANNMTVSNFTSTTSPASNTTDVSGNLTLNVGADLGVGANQASGTYTGTYGITISY